MLVNPRMSAKRIVIVWLNSAEFERLRVLEHLLHDILGKEPL
jgi:hypothetical protein